MPDARSYGIESTPAGIIIRVCVVPRASANRIVGAHNGELKVALTAPPVEGAANKALVEFLAKALGVPKGNVSLISGQTSRHKVVRAQGLSPEDALRKLVAPG